MKTWKAKGWDCRLVFDDWRQIGVAGSNIYDTLSTGGLHAGVTFQATIILEIDDSEVEEIKEAYRKHKAYPVFAVLPREKEQEGK